MRYKVFLADTFFFVDAPSIDEVGAIALKEMINRLDAESFIIWEDPAEDKPT